MPATLRVDIIGEMTANELAMHYATDGRWQASGDTPMNGQQLAEFAGRACFESWSKPHPGRQDNRSYLAHILEVEHFSVLRHGVVTLYIQGVSRNLTHELIRHHIGIDYSQLSQRYVDAAEMDYVVPPAMRGDEFLERRLKFMWDAAVAQYALAVNQMEKQDIKGKKAREAARAFLPGCAETKIVVTANLQAWRNFIQQRATLAADAEIRELAVEVARIMQQGFPHAFQDMAIWEADGPAPAVVSWS